MSAIPDHYLPVIFLGLMGLAMLLYTLLDGFDLGTGLLMAGKPEQHRDKMIASIGPFWDANETWLVLGVGVMLVAFPVAHGVILGKLYIPVTLMLVGLILRGVSFDFRAKAKAKQKNLWDHCFVAGSLLATLTQGYMLGIYITGFSQTIPATLFAILSALCVTSAYMLMGASWLILKTTGDLQKSAIQSARSSLLATALGLLVVSIVNPLVSPELFDKWLSVPQLFLLAPLPIATAALLAGLYRVLNQYSENPDTSELLPLLMTTGVFILAFAGLAYSFYPMIVPGQLTVWEAAASPQALRVILWGCVITLPAILCYTVLSYYLFRGKTTELTYT